MKKIIAFILTASVLLVLASCGDYTDHPEYSDVTYKERGLEFTLRNDMRRSETDDYDFYFTNLAGTMVFSASKVNSKVLSSVGLDSSASPQNYVDAIIERNGFDREMIYYSYDESRGIHSFRYSIGDDSGGIFYYVAVLGDAGNVWYVEMVCSEEDSGLYVDRFDTFKNSLRTYTEQ